MDKTQLSFKKWKDINIESFIYKKCDECSGTGICQCCENGECADCDGKGKFLVDIKTQIPIEFLYKQKYNNEKIRVECYG